MFVDGMMLNRLLKLFSRKDLRDSNASLTKKVGTETDILEVERLSSQGIGDSDDLGEPDSASDIEDSDQDTLFGLHADPIAGEILDESERQARVEESAEEIGHAQDTDNFSDMIEI